ncbi:hypothetical protein HY838_00700 [Candidatus Azambacteria bacterium]|nr:hypothetical protein [Candidatus Azambacteria bacterium]
MNEEKLLKVKNIVYDFFVKSRIADFEIKTVEASADGSINISISAKETGFYIGENGKHIPAFEILLRLIIKKQIESAPLIHLDINNYRNLKDDSLRELAKKAARRARFYKQPVALEAMTAYERRIVHTELAAHPDIKTESAGEGAQRRVVVKYID